jgi:predicted ArsR family transcriptional regulator
VTAGRLPALLFTHLPGETDAGRVLRFIGTGVQTVRDIAEALGVSLTAVRDVLRGLVMAGRLAAMAITMPKRRGLIMVYWRSVAAVAPWLCVSS